MKNYSEDALRNFVLELKREGMFNDKRLNSFQKTEQLLYRRNDFADAVNAKKEQIEELKKHGLKRHGTEQEKLNDKIVAIERAVDYTEKYINFINDALDKLRNDKFYEIIPMKYFKGMTHEEIGFEFEVDASTICRNKTRLINILVYYLFSDEVSDQIIPNIRLKSVNGYGKRVAKRLDVTTRLKAGHIRVIQIEDKTYFVGNDVCKILGHVNPYNAISQHCKEVLSWDISNTIGANRAAKIIPESDIYRLIAKVTDVHNNNLVLRKKAKEFERWFTNNRHLLVTGDGIQFVPYPNSNS